MTDREFRYELQLSRELHMTRERMRLEMPSFEYIDQMGYDSVLEDERKKAERLADKGMSQRRPGRR